MTSRPHHDLRVYLPQDRRHALLHGLDLPSRSEGAVLFADISGFTPMTEALTRAFGPRRGAEELTRQLNVVYDALIAEVEGFGGSVIGFSGDGMTCWFPAADAPLHAVTHRAVAAALAIQVAMQPHQEVPILGANAVRLAVKVAVGAGMTRRCVVGDPAIQQLDLLTGSTLARMARAEHLAAPGDVVLDPVAVALLGTELIGLPVPEEPEGYFRVTALATPLAPSIPPRPFPEASTAESDLWRPWVLDTLRDRLEQGQDQFLTALRPAVALFVGFEGLDYDEDEQVAEKLDGFIRATQAILTRYEGTLLDVTIGDKGSYLYAVLGAPVTHEDDAARAVMAALDLRALPKRFPFLAPLRIGISQGTVRTGEYGGATRRSYGVIGDEVNLAARLMQAAAPGAVLVTAHTRNAAERFAATHHYTWEPLATLQVKGKAEPVPVFALHESQGTRAVRLQEPTYALPMVGREAELATIVQRLEAALAGRGQIVTIIAEAGMGKSRLVAAAMGEVKARWVRVYAGAGQSYGQSTPYLVWSPIWRAFFGVDGDASVAEQQAALERHLRAINPALLPRLPLLGMALNLALPDTELTRAMDAEQRKRGLESLLVDCVWGQASHEPCVFILEDAHWMDPLSHDLLRAIAQAIESLPVLLILATRPPYELLARIFDQHPYATSLALDVLNPEEAERFAQRKLRQMARRLGRDEAGPPPPSLLEQLYGRAEGNPFYLEELLNYLEDRALDPWDEASVAALDLPTSLHSLVLSRIDQLNERQQTTIRLASVIGRLFPVRWLLGAFPALNPQEQLRSDLELLNRLDLTPLDSPDPELTYLFKHIVTQEVAYESMPYATRAILHGQIGDFLEAWAKQSSQLHALLDLLAFHYSRSENLAKQREYLARAAEAAKAAFANHAAVDYYQRLLPLLTDPVAQVRSRLSLGQVLHLLGRWDEAKEGYLAALDVAVAHALAVEQAECQHALGHLAFLQGEWEKALTWFYDAKAGWEALGATRDVRAELSHLLAEIGMVYWRRDDTDASLTILQESLVLARAVGDNDRIGFALHHLGNIYGLKGRTEEAIVLIEEGLERYRASGLLSSLSAGLNDLAVVYWMRQDVPKALEVVRSGLALAREIGDKPVIALTLTNLGYLLTVTGSPHEALAYLEEGGMLYRMSGERPALTTALNNQGLVWLMLNTWDAAYKVYREAFLISRELQHTVNLAYSMLGLATILAEADGSADALRRVVQVNAAARALLAVVDQAAVDIEVQFHERGLEQARKVLAEADFQAAWDEGGGWSIEESSQALGLPYP